MSRFFWFLCIIFVGNAKEELIATQKRQIITKSLQMSNVNMAKAATILAQPNINNDSINELISVYNINEEQARSEEICDELNLSSLECYQECIYYTSPLLIIPQLLEGSNDTNALRIFNYYRMSGGPISYDSVGNPDMCEYNYGTYCYIPASFSGIFTLAERGCCVPGTCKGEDAVKIVQADNWCYGSFALLWSNIDPGIGVEERCEIPPRKYSFGFWMVILTFIIFLLLVLSATLYKQYKFEYTGEQEFGTFISIFNLQDSYQNFSRLRSNSSMNFLDGIRVWSMLWVIYGHALTMYAQFSNVSNSETLIPVEGLGGPPREDFNYVANRWYMALAFQGLFSVDTFFWLSGLLGAFSVIRQVKKYGNKAFRLSFIWIPMSIFIRFLRIAPMMMYVTSIEWKVEDQVINGYRVSPNRDVYNNACSKAWYSILLFYQNFKFIGLDLSSMEGLEDFEQFGCMGHLWYLQCDMQMFLLLPFLCLIYHYSKLAGIAASLIPTIVCVALRIHYAIYYNFGYSLFIPNHLIKNDGDYFSDSYIQPWTRMAPYFIGVTTIFIALYINETRKGYKLSKIVYLFLMLLSGFMLLMLVFVPYDDVKNAPAQRWSTYWDSFTYVVNRPLWGLALSLLFVALYFKPHSVQSIVNKLLSFELYQPLGKLTFTMYLIHFPIYNWWTNDVALPLYYTFWNIILLFAGVSLLTAFFTIILWFVMEKPIANMVTKFIALITCKKDKKKEDVLKPLKEIKAAKQILMSMDGGYKGTGNYESFASVTKDGFDTTIRDVNETSHEIKQTDALV